LFSYNSRDGEYPYRKEFLGKSDGQHENVQPEKKYQLGCAGGIYGLHCGGRISLAILEKAYPL